MPKRFPPLPDVSLPGVIYAPGGEANEYSALAISPYNGCGHRCAYCYVPQQTKQRRVAFDRGAVLKPNWFERLEKACRKYQRAGRQDQIFMTFTSDPWHAGDTTPTRCSIEMLQEYGLGVCTLSKGGSQALRDLPLFRPSRDA